MKQKTERVSQMTCTTPKSRRKGNMNKGFAFQKRTSISLISIEKELGDLLADEGTKCYLFAKFMAKES